MSQRQTFCIRLHVSDLSQHGHHKHYTAEKKGGVASHALYGPFTGLDDVASSKSDFAQLNNG